jgi:hypothetical protein
MSNIPVFVEVPDSKDVGICQRAVKILEQQNFPSLAYATSLPELQDIIKQFAERSLQPGVFIINTYKAKEIIPQLDGLMGETPAVFLRRGMYAGQSGLMNYLAVDENKNSAQQNTLMAIKKLTLRLTSIWSYGAKNTDQVAQRVARCVLRFSEDGEFKHFEIANPVGSNV